MMTINRAASDRTCFVSVSPDAQPRLLGWPLRCCLAFLLLALCGQAQAQIVSAVLPSSRSVAVGHTATAFATIINAGTTAATGCGIALPTGISATFSYNTTNPNTNATTGAANTPANIPAGGFQTYVFAITPTAAFASTEIALSFTCSGLDPAPTLSGINTLRLTATASAGPDIVALVATTGGNGTVALPSQTGAAAFAVATVNVGVADSIMVSADTNGVTVPVTVTLCQTNPVTGACLGTPNPTVSVSIPANGTPTFGVFVTGTDNVAALPGANRIAVRFTGSSGTVVGSTSVAVQTTGYVAPVAPAVAFVASVPTNATARTAYSYCYCSPTPSGANGLCGFPAQSNPSGGHPPYHFQLGSGGGFPPLGVVLLPNGCLSGKPTVAGTSNFTVCAIDLNGAQICRPTSVMTLPATGTTYVGPLSGAGNYTRNFPGFTTCSFHDSYTGTIMVNLSTPAGGTPSGTVTITGTWVSTATGGSTANFTCNSTSTALDSSGPVTISGSTLSWSTNFPTLGGSTVTGAFNGTFNASSVSGTVTELIDTSSGSAVIPVTLTATP
jgi:hypothetical protein